jgi:fluoroacetyl-CoA thioesterase
MELECGIKCRIDKIVETKDTAKAMGSGNEEVFATPSMIALMENAAFTAAEDSLPEGSTTVGTAIDIKHLAATPMGLRVWAEAVLIGVEGRKLIFSVEAYDEREKIGEGTHTRFIVDRQKFIQKVYGKV